MPGARLRALFVAILVAAMVLGPAAPSLHGAATAKDGGAACADCDPGPGDGDCALACSAVPAIGAVAHGSPRIGSASFAASVGDDGSGLASGPDPSPPRL